MTILMMKAFGDFDARYDINIAVGDNARVSAICEVLNGYCKELPGCEQDVRLSAYLANIQCVNELVGRLTTNALFSEYQAKKFVEKLATICVNHWVYVYSNTFTVEEVPQI